MLDVEGYIFNNECIIDDHDSWINYFEKGDGCVEHRTWRYYGKACGFYGNKDGSGFGNGFYTKRYIRF